MAALCCSTLPVHQQVAPTTKALGNRPARRGESATDTAASGQAFSRERLFLVHSDRAELLLRSLSSGAEHRLACNVQHVLHDPALELVWFSDEQRLWVVDLRTAWETQMPVLIANDLPPHVEIHVERCRSNVTEPVDACDLAPFLHLHWVEEPWLAGGSGSGLTDLDGRTWLASERLRAALPATEALWFHPSDPKVALPPARAHCEDGNRCGVSLPFGAANRELVLTDQSEGGDCWNFGCLLRDSESGDFGTPPQPAHWGSAENMPAGPCGPYRFNADSGAFLVKDLVCEVGGSCKPLRGQGLGWLTPGTTLGAPG